MKRELADGITIRFGAVDEAPRLALIARRAGDPIEAEIIDAFAAAGRVFVAQDLLGDVPIGLAAVGELDGILAVESLCVLPDWRGRGIGSALLTSVEEYGRWAFFGQALIVPRTAPAAEFLFRRGWLTIDSGGMPPDVARLGNGNAVLTRRL
ncbi:MAG: GNAT family N-acetyltransferase [Alsobacter sp.]|jgi:GNAT superfamily N-acetyltransferase|nr:GNAT family N-acetyltransferase [Burkholderiales bacterium]